MLYALLSLLLLLLPPPLTLSINLLSSSPTVNFCLEALTISKRMLIDDLDYLNYFQGK